jgi:predicted house-cleaning noncanonical NTP pyrophosphatase (MazG superfamily)
MRKEYNKLVRDRIPEIIRESGRECAVEVMSDSEYPCGKSLSKRRRRDATRVGRYRKVS